MKAWAVRGVISLERGEINNNLHCQGIFTLGMKKSFSGDDKKEEAALRKKMRVDSGWKTEDHLKITIKRLVRQQTFSGKLLHSLRLFIHSVGFISTWATGGFSSFVLCIAP